jgi:methionyl-tRNA formyltransferase
MMENNFMEFKYESRDEKSASFFGRPTEKDLIINWETMNAESIRDLARAANPKYSGAIAFFNNIPLRIIQVTISREDNSGNLPGAILDSKNGFIVKTIDNKTVSLDIIYTMEGCYTGVLFQKLFGLKTGNRFDLIK